jgi:hypothetical protein
MADDPDETQDRFAPLDEVPVPAWRDRTTQKLDAGTVVPLADVAGDPRRWPLAVAAAAVVAVLVAGILAWPRDDGDDEQVAAGGPAGFGDLPEVDHPLLCPPALLDLSALDVQPSAVGAGPRELGDPAPYNLTWQQDGYEVVVSYPGPIVRTLDLPPHERVTLSDGRVARVQYRAAVTADVGVDDGRLNQCSGFWLSVRPVPTPSGPVSPSDPARTELIALAEAIRIRAPEGSVAVPDIVGRDVVTAQDTLARAGLIPTGDAPAFHQLEDQPVVAQTPKPGTVVPIGDEVSLALAPEVTTTTTLPPPIDDVQLPIPDVALECPLVRLAVSGGVYSEPKVHSGHTLQWHNGGGYDVLLRWPPTSHVLETTGVRELEVAGRAALMLDGGDGQNLLFDTGLPPGPCQYLEIGVYGGDSVEERESRAVALAEDSITFPPIPDMAPPDVVGLPLPEAVDRLARAGFIADWGARPRLGDEIPHPPADLVTAQRTEPDYVVALDT